MANAIANGTQLRRRLRQAFSDAEGNKKVLEIEVRGKERLDREGNDGAGKGVLGTVDPIWTGLTLFIYRSNVLLATGDEALCSWQSNETSCMALY